MWNYFFYIESDLKDQIRRHEGLSDPWSRIPYQTLLKESMKQRLLPAERILLFPVWAKVASAIQAAVILSPRIVAPLHLKAWLMHAMQDETILSKPQCPYISLEMLANAKEVLRPLLDKLAHVNDLQRAGVKGTLVPDTEVLKDMLDILIVPPVMGEGTRSPDANWCDLASAW